MITEAAHILQSKYPYTKKLFLVSSRITFNKKEGVIRFSKLEENTRKTYEVQIVAYKRTEFKNTNANH